MMAAFVLNEKKYVDKRRPENAIFTNERTRVSVWRKYGLFVTR